MSARNSNQQNRVPDRDSLPGQSKNKVEKSIAISISRGRGAKMQLTGSSYRQMSQIRLIDESNRVVPTQSATAKLNRGRTYAILIIEIQKAAVGSKLFVQGRVGQRWTRMPITINVTSEKAGVALQVEDAKLLTLDNKGRLHVAGPGQGTTTVRLPGGGTAIIGPDKFPGGDELGMSNPTNPDNTNDTSSSAIGAIANAFNTSSSSYNKSNAYLLATLSSHVYHAELTEWVGPGSQWNFETVKTIENSATDTQGAVLSTPDMIVVVFRGTEGPNLNDWMADLNYEMVDVPHFGIINDETCKLHKGFSLLTASVYVEFRDRISACQNANNNKPVYFAGHSLGGGHRRDNGLQVQA